jgi:hypothetical protein
MATNRFRVPIVVYEGGFGFLLISTLADASRFLFHHWPGHHTPIWGQAMR